MEYKGKLYGKVGKHYFPLESTTDDFDKLLQENEEMKAMLEDILLKISEENFTLKETIEQLLTKINQ